ncbi:uncharacterized protein LOC131891200 [Tigriopus californicus]|uniref:uncharacterized protein LOC131891200 n=1 Tax=Tigriopus californicus TaxID=6832 RepID=UPI0027DA2437|nr:uncharacterized protein LOC131891200 [Tigriopus californicus]
MRHSVWKGFFFFLTFIGGFIRPTTCQFWFEQTDSEILRYDRLDEQTDIGTAVTEDYAGAMDYRWFLNEADNDSPKAAHLKVVMKHNHIAPVSDYLEPNISAEVRMKYVKDAVQFGMLQPSNTNNHGFERKGMDHFLMGTNDYLNGNIAEYNLRLPRLPKLKRSVLSFHHLCGTKSSVQPEGECQIWVEMTKANWSDQRGSLIHKIDPIRFFNNKTVHTISEWQHEKIPIPPLVEFETFRLNLRGRHDKDNAILGLDNIHIGTRERCSPR